ncbi:hypothetical protein B0H19DRAFT_1064158 [Mycena capillaripes]|nr:hypothetical protein B0H19DRAFT_1064158 [Mycena capillaripes]
MSASRSVSGYAQRSRDTFAPILASKLHHVSGRSFEIVGPIRGRLHSLALADGPPLTLHDFPSWKLKELDDYYLTELRRYEDEAQCSNGTVESRRIANQNCEKYRDAHLEVAAAYGCFTRGDKGGAPSWATKTGSTTAFEKRLESLVGDKKNNSSTHLLD